MYFTKAQVRALWFVICVLTAAIIFQYVKYYALSKESYDFSTFDSLFLARKDSILRLPPSRDTLTPQQYQKQSAAHSESFVIQQFPVNINKANLEELQALPKIGPAMARRIVEYRQTNGPFKTATEIKKVRGIGEKTYQKLQDLITIE